MVTQRPRDLETESFAGLLLRYRGRTGLTQRDLAARLATNRRSIQDWESGAYYPSAERLQALIHVLLESGGLTVGCEAVEAHALWAAALSEAPRMHTPLDEVWLEELLAQRKAPQPQLSRDVKAPESAFVERTQHWSEAPDVITFVGRADELAMLRQWVAEHRCRLVAVLGMGGIGKTALASRLAQDAAPGFQRVYWQSLRDALLPGEWLAGAIGFLSAYHVVPPEGEAARLATLLRLLRDRPSLLVLDNFETVLEPGQQEGHYRDGFGGYRPVLQAIGQTGHQSCLVVTSREAPPELAVLGGSAVRRLQLGGLGVPDGRVLLADKQLSGTDEEWATLIARFGGNSLALKVVSENIREVFGGHVGAFLEVAGSSSIFGGVRRLLAEQIGRSSALEQRLLRVLAVEREPAGLAELIADLGPRVRQAMVVEAVEALRRRSLVEHARTSGAAAFTLQSVVLEYVTERLVEDVADEIARDQPMLLVEQPLIKAQAKDYVRQTQERLIGAPILQLLTTQHGTDSAEQRLLALLDGWRNRPEAEQGYGPGNVVNLVRLRRGDLRGVDLARLVLQHICLAEVEAQDASLAGARLSGVTLPQAFTYPTCLAISADGGHLAAGTTSGEVCVWRTADRALLAVHRAQAGTITGVAITPDGRLMASGSYDGTLRIWDVQSGKLYAALQGPAEGLLAAALSADGQLAASGGFDGAIRVWDAPSARLIRILESQGGAVRGVALSRDGQLAAGGSEDGTVRLWDVKSGSLRASLAGHTGLVYHVALSGDSHVLASGSFDGSVRLWQVDTGQPLALLEGHTRGVWSVALSDNGGIVLSGSEDGTVRLWSSDNWTTVAGEPLLAVLQGHVSGVRGVALSGDGRLAASGSEDSTVRFWDSATRRSLATIQGYTSGVRGVALRGHANVVAGGSYDGTVNVWDGSSGKLLRTLRGHTGGVRGVSLSSDGHVVVSGSYDGTVRAWEVDTGRLLRVLSGESGGVRSVTLSGGGRLLASGSFDSMVRLWDLTSGSLLDTLRGHSGGVWSVAISADGELLASGSEDGTVRLWEAKTGRSSAILRGHAGGVWGVALSADNRLVASSSFDRTVRVWETATGRPLARLRGHTGGVWCVALGGDGRLVASGSADRTVRLWDAASEQNLRTLRGHSAAVWGVALSLDGSIVASGSADGTVRLWNVNSGAELFVLRGDRRYERMDITGLSGVTAAQREALLALGAIDHTGA